MGGRYIAATMTPASKTEPGPVHDPLLFALGRRVRDLRMSLHLTRKELSRRSGVSERYLADLEGGKGNISISRLAQVARALGTTPKHLLPDGDGPKVVSLLGLRGAGKSTVGARLGDALDVPFLELDALVEADAGLSLREIFDFHGEDYYRKLERDVLGRFLEEGRPAVLGTGGGIVTSTESYERLLRDTITVWLRADPEDHWNRVLGQGDERPMADNPHAMAELRSLLSRRAPLYARADHTVDTSCLDVDGVVARLVRLVRQDGAMGGVEPG